MLFISLAYQMVRVVIWNECHWISINTSKLLKVIYATDEKFPKYLTVTRISASSLLTLFSEQGEICVFDVVVVVSVFLYSSHIVLYQWCIFYKYIHFLCLGTNVHIINKFSSFLT